MRFQFKYLIITIMVSLVGVSFLSSNTYADTYFHNPMELSGRSYSNVDSSHHPYLYTGSEPNGSFHSHGDYFDYVVPSSYKIMNGSTSPSDHFSGVDDYYSLNMYFHKSVLGKVIVLKNDFDFRFNNEEGEAVSTDILKRTYNPLVTAPYLYDDYDSLKPESLSCYKDKSSPSGCFGSFFHNFMLHNSFYNSGAVPLKSDELLLDFRGLSEEDMKRPIDDSFSLKLRISVSEAIVKRSDSEYWKSKALWYYSDDRDIYVGKDNYIEASDFTGSEDDLKDSIEANNANIAKAADDITNGWHSGPTGDNNDGGVSSILSNLGSFFKPFFDKILDFFKFSVVDPFSYLFSMFIDGTCVDVPIIAGLLHTNSHYCSWWDVNIRSILTPVFMIASTMILWGFVVSWLKKGVV